MVEENFRDDIRDGISKSYYENGKLEQEGTFKYGRPKGTFKYYIENGKLILEETYKDGKLIDSKEY